MIYTDIYKVNLIGGSYRITVPIEWIRSNGITSKDTLKMIVGDFVVILPPKRLSPEKIEAMIEDCKKLIEMMQRDEDGKV